ncbi:MAG: peptidoglycan DD-metalloendopeptidase family protein [Oscillospiraceae bacterium]|nr:peptidoglycan DD-metalloendopeptidase family protein [Oscillospiraceae bacterium]
MLKRVLAIVLTLVLAVGGLSIAAHGAASNATGWHTSIGNIGVALRQSRNVNATNLVTIPRGYRNVQITAVSHFNGEWWGRATHAGRTGYVRMMYMVRRYAGVFDVTLNANRVTRDQASTAGAVRSEIQSGRRLAIFAVNGNWGRMSNGRWVYLGGATIHSTATNPNRQMQVNTAAGLHLRRFPHASATSLGTAPNNTPVTVTAQVNGFGRVTWNGQTGWMSMNFLRDRAAPPNDTGIRFPMRGSMTHSSRATWGNTGILCDFRAPMNTRIYAPADGTVSFRQSYTRFNNVRTLTSFGNQIIFTSSCRRYTMRMAHLNSFNGVALQIPSSQTRQQSGAQNTITLATRTVRQGDFIGLTGRTGNANGPHLHLEFSVDNRPTNPVGRLRTW